MAKYYYVPLYDVRYGDGFRGQAMYVSDIIVGKTWNQVFELLTEHKIDILPDSSKINEFGVIAEEYHDEKQFDETGHHLVVFKSSLKTANLVTPTMIDSYVDEYECDDNEFSRVYEDIKSKAESPKKKDPTLQQKVKQYQGTKK